MRQEEVVEMAIQACAFGYVYDAGDTPHLWQFDNKQLQAFANLVADKEREACAQIADEWSVGYPHPSTIIAAAIRARGEQA